MIQLKLTHHDVDCVDLGNKILCGREMFLYLKIECHNPYSIGPLDVTGLVVVAVAEVVESEKNGRKRKISMNVFFSFYISNETVVDVCY